MPSWVIQPECDAPVSAADRELYSTRPPAWQAGVEGSPRPFTPATDSGVLAIVIAVIVLIGLNMRHVRRIFRSLPHDLFSVRRRDNAFDEHTANETRVSILQLFQMWVFQALLLFMWLGHITPATTSAAVTAQVALLVALGCGFYLFQLAANITIGYTFTDPLSATLWRRGLNSSQILLGWTLIRLSSEKSPYFDIASRYGVEMIFRPFIKVEGLSAREFRHQKINIADFTAVIFTARTAIDHFFRLCEEMRIAIPDTMKYFCTSESIALYLQKYIVYRKRKIFYGATGKFEDLLPFLSKHNKDKFLYVVSDVHKDDKNAPILDRAKVDYAKAVMYRTVSNDFADGEPFDYDMLLFFSPAGIESLKKNFPDFNQGDIKIGCFGASTAKAVADAGLRLDLEAPNPKAPSITAALDLYLRDLQGA